MLIARLVREEASSISSPMASGISATFVAAERSLAFSMCSLSI
jgi:hypothetical protein